MRLIDADVFEKFIRKNCTDSLVDLWCELVRRQPTAYDVDKVVEQLEELRELDACDFDNCPVEYIQCCDCTQKRMAERAIKIVKDYGVDER